MRAWLVTARGCDCETLDVCALFDTGDGAEALDRLPPPGPRSDELCLRSAHSSARTPDHGRARARAAHRGRRRRRLPRLRTPARGGRAHRRAPRAVAGGGGSSSCATSPSTASCSTSACRTPAASPRCERLRDGGARRRASRADRRPRRPARRRGGRRGRAGLPRQGQRRRRRPAPRDPLRRRAPPGRQRPRAVAGGRDPAPRRPRASSAGCCRCRSCTTARSRVGTGYRPGRERTLLGGDFYDAVQTPDGAVHLVIGDVAGHGPDEAALGVCLRVAWRTLTLAGARAEAVLPTLQRRARPRARRGGDLRDGLDGDRRPGPPHREPAQRGPSAARAPRRRRAGRRSTARARACRSASSTTPRWPVRLALPPRWGLLLSTDGLIEGRASGGSAAPGRWTG